MRKLGSSGGRSAGARGYVLLLMMVGLATIGLLLAAQAGREAVAYEQLPAVSARHQALWLARSAQRAGWVGTRTVETRAGEAQVVSNGRRVRVTLAGGEAWVEGEDEGYEAR